MGLFPKGLFPELPLAGLFGLGFGLFVLAGGLAAAAGVGRGLNHDYRGLSTSAGRSASPRPNGASIARYQAR